MDGAGRGAGYLLPRPPHSLSNLERSISLPVSLPSVLGAGKGATAAISSAGRLPGGGAPAAAASGIAVGAAATEKSVEGESPARAAVIGLPEERAGASVAANPVQLGPPVAGLAEVP